MSQFSARVALDLLCSTLLVMLKSKYRSTIVTPSCNCIYCSLFSYCFFASTNTLAIIHAFLQQHGWISEQNWDNITELDKVPGFHGIIDSFEQNFKSWNAWYATTFPEQEDLIGEWNDKLTDFQKICVVRSLRPDRISFCMTQFIISKLGPRYVEPPVLDLKATFEESISQTPLIFVLSPGVDPAQSLISLSETVKMSQPGVNYGGHVTDDWDRRLLTTYINQFYCDQALHTRKFRFSSLTNYFIPDDGDLQSYIDQIQMLPNFDKPEAFGQHPNADIASLIGETRMLFETLLSMQAQTSSGGTAENAEAKVLDLAKDIMLGMPDEINYEQTAKIIGINRTPLEVVLLQEIERYNALIDNMRAHLIDLRRGIQGLVVMSSDLEEIYLAVYEGRVPLQWLKSYNSLKPLAAWARDLNLRVGHFNIWAKTLRPPSLFWLAAYTFPTGFLTAVLQTAARTTKTPIDELSWEFYVFIEEDAAAARIIREGGGVYIRNLFLEGAGWLRKNQCLQDPLPMELICPLPVIHFKPVDNLKKRIRGVYQCPAYYYPVRSGSFIIAIDLRSGTEKADYWIKRGTAILLSLPA
ncbi:dynein heavy chain 2, axonemal-like [Scaptodrosophila lebanonensis]|uniref:Dynein heavy chain 2, axonemal-like n=1 Tax=Drosophila lebanonensis TaxID=7225 RepID=A0A6J2U186_DROLE|nr:dynein heavy chain 2, axonemal-like [Scaptodrosophila lebanonensis]